MSTVALHPTLLRRPRRRVGARLLALALVPGSAAAAGAVPALAATDAQSRLVALGHLSVRDATGGWTPATTEAVRRFQVSHGLVPDGVAGAATADRLLAA